MSERGTDTCHALSTTVVAGSLRRKSSEERRNEKERTACCMKERLDARTRRAQDTGDAAASPSSCPDRPGRNQPTAHWWWCLCGRFERLPTYAHGVGWGGRYSPTRVSSIVRHANLGSPSHRPRVALNCLLCVFSCTVPMMKVAVHPCMASSIQEWRHLQGVSRVGRPRKTKSRDMHRRGKWLQMARTSGTIEERIASCTAAVGSVL